MSFNGLNWHIAPSVSYQPIMGKINVQGCKLCHANGHSHYEYQGHTSKNCPRYGIVTQSSFNCSSKGNPIPIAFWNSNSSSNQVTTCAICNKTDHADYQHTCNNCYQTGHNSWNCPNTSTSRNSSSSSSSNKFCGGCGHKRENISNNCCTNCGKRY